eukprot:TRINITY_DN1393_c0_g1_i2.p1 TRINITY_DN1393_c0_g1~~TRINITY_DN1393_c0_g1_i2.p1  ORF type:complete len:150 (-),score=19.86 TRINITY_DN1393_c0_g1_i2:53-502(-)
MFALNHETNESYMIHRRDSSNVDDLLNRDDITEQDRNNIRGAKQLVEIRAINPGTLNRYKISYHGIWNYEDTLYQLLSRNEHFGVCEDFVINFLSVGSLELGFSRTLVKTFGSIFSLGIYLVFDRYRRGIIMRESEEEANAFLQYFGVQ